MFVWTVLIVEVAVVTVLFCVAFLVGVVVNTGIADVVEETVVLEIEELFTIGVVVAGIEVLFVTLLEVSTDVVVCCSVLFDVDDDVNWGATVVVVLLLTVVIVVSFEACVVETLTVTTAANVVIVCGGMVEFDADEVVVFEVVMAGVVSGVTFVTVVVTVGDDVVVVGGAQHVNVNDASGESETDMSIYMYDKALFVKDFNVYCIFNYSYSICLCIYLQMSCHFDY